MTIISRISEETGVDVDAISQIVRTASHRYKTYTVPKRTGGRRVISHPTPELKFLQRWVVRRFISHLPVHRNVFSYKSGMGISQNAEMHVAQNYLLKMDFADFFPSIKGSDVRALLLSNLERLQHLDIAAGDVDIIVQISCRNDQLTIGAPSSPAISNAALYAFDDAVNKECSKRLIVYTRYADDIVFSTNEPKVLEGMVEYVRSALGMQASPRLKINDKKTVFTSRKRLRAVTGLTLTSDRQVSIGRSQKRKVKSLCYQFSRNELVPEDASYLRGYLAYVNAVEPSFVDRLREKYGADLIRRITELSPIRRK